MINKVILIGNVGADPEVRALETGVKMARLRLATTERFYNAATGEKREHTEWHTVILWRGQADFAEKYIHKGSQIYVSGKIRSREWTEEATGAKRYSVEILADEVRLLGGRAATTSSTFAPAVPISAGTPPATSSVPSEAPEVSAPLPIEDLPF